MKRILLVTDIFPPQIGGPATFVDRLGAALVRRGAHPAVVCSSETRYHASDQQRNYPVWRVPLGNRLRHALEFRLQVARGLLTHHLALVNNQEYAAYQVAARLGKPYVVKIVGDTVWETARNQALTSLSVDEFQSQTPTHPLLIKLAARRRLYLGAARRVITPSEHLKGLVVGWGISPERVRVVPNGVPVEDYRALSPTPRLPGEPLRVAFSGRLVNWKGVETLLLAAVGLPEVQLSILGDGPELPMLQILARQLGVAERVRFWGRLQGDAYLSALKQAHALVLMSSYEGFSHTLLEAGAAGLACVASRCGGNPELIQDGVNGLLVNYGDVAGLQAALRHLARHEPDRYRLAGNARKQVAEHFSFERTVEGVLDVLAEVIP